MTDDQAKQLIELLTLYLRLYSAGVQHVLTVDEVLEDLKNSL